MRAMEEAYSFKNYLEPKGKYVKHNPFSAQKRKNAIQLMIKLQTIRGYYKETLMLAL